MKNLIPQDDYCETYIQYLLSTTLQDKIENLEKSKKISEAAKLSESEKFFQEMRARRFIYNKNVEEDAFETELLKRIRDISYLPGNDVNNYKKEFARVTKELINRSIEISEDTTYFYDNVDKIVKRNLGIKDQIYLYAKPNSILKEELEKLLSDLEMEILENGNELNPGNDALEEIVSFYLDTIDYKPEVRALKSLKRNDLLDQEDSLGILKQARINVMMLNGQIEYESKITLILETIKNKLPKLNNLSSSVKNFYHDMLYSPTKLLA